MKYTECVKNSVRVTQLSTSAIQEQTVSDSSSKKNYDVLYLNFQIVLMIQGQVDVYMRNMHNIIFMTIPDI